MMIGVGAGLTNSCRIHRWLIYVDNISDIHTANGKLIVFMWPGLFNMSLVWNGRGYDVGGDPGNPWKASISLHQCLTCDGTRQHFLSHKVFQHLTMPDKILRAMLERFTALAGTNRVTGPFGDPATPSIAQNAPPLSIAVGFYALHKNTGNQNSILYHPLEIAHT